MLLLLWLLGPGGVSGSCRRGAGWLLLLRLLDLAIQTVGPGGSPAQIHLALPIHLAPPLEVGVETLHHRFGQSRGRGLVLEWRPRLELAIELALEGRRPRGHPALLQPERALAPTAP